MHPTDGRITQEVFNPNQASGQAFPHTGRDYAGNRGDTIRTIADGDVLYVTRENEPVPAWLANRFMLVPGSMAGGNSLFIQHDGWVEYFGHMQNITVKAGDRVRRGQRVGGVGDSGNASGCHLHYEVIAEPCPASYPWGRYHPQNQIDYEDAHGGAASIMPTGNTTQEEEAPMSQAEVNQIIKAVTAEGDLTRKHLINVTNDQHTDTRKLISAEHDLTRKHLINVGNDQEGATRKFLAERITEGVKPDQVADSVIAALGTDLAKQVAIELGNRLAGDTK